MNMNFLFTGKKGLFFNLRKISGFYVCIYNIPYTMFLFATLGFFFMPLLHCQSVRASVYLFVSMCIYELLHASLFCLANFV